MNYFERILVRHYSNILSKSLITKKEQTNATLFISNNVKIHSNKQEIFICKTVTL